MIVTRYNLEIARSRRYLINLREEVYQGTLIGNV